VPTTWANNKKQSYDPLVFTISTVTAARQGREGLGFIQTTLKQLTWQNPEALLALGFFCGCVRKFCNRSRLRKRTGWFYDIFKQKEMKKMETQRHRGHGENRNKGHQLSALCASVFQRASVFQPVNGYEIFSKVTHLLTPTTVNHSYRHVHK